MTDVPREPSHYWPSIHAKQRARDGDIEWQQVSKTIQEGNIRRTERPECKIFVRDFPHKDIPLRVVANYQTGEIVTTYWRQDRE